MKPTWITLDKSSGSAGSSQVKVTASPYYAGSYRSGVLTVSSGEKSVSVNILQRKPVTVDIYFIEQTSSGEQKWGVTVSDFSYVAREYDTDYFELNPVANGSEYKTVEIPLDGATSLDRYEFTLPSEFTYANTDWTSENSDGIRIFDVDGKDTNLNLDFDVVNVYRKSSNIYIFTGPSSASDGTLYPKCNLRVGLNTTNTQPPDGGYPTSLSSPVYATISVYDSNDNMLGGLGLAIDSLYGWMTGIFGDDFNVADVARITVSCDSDYYNEDFTGAAQSRTYIRNIYIRKESLLLTIGVDLHTNSANFQATSPYPVTSPLTFRVNGEGGSSYNIMFSMSRGSQRSMSGIMTIDDNNTTWSSYSVSPTSDAFYEYLATIL